MPREAAAMMPAMLFSLLLLLPHAASRHSHAATLPCHDARHAAIFIDDSFSFHYAMLILFSHAIAAIFILLLPLFSYAER